MPFFFYLLPFPLPEAMQNLDNILGTILVPPPSFAHVFEEFRDQEKSSSVIKTWKQKLFVAEKHPINVISLWRIDKFKAVVQVAMGTRFYLLC